MRAERLPNAEADDVDVLTEVGVAKEKSEMLRKALASPDVSSDVKEHLRQSANEKRQRLTEAGEDDAAAYYDFVESA